ncbi:hypothetical protein [Capnocytophaga felis]|uniref:Uncharacterized protein n=1 Tax=Capnocytophaga felis TaxID=2267611 RepID=A0A5M4BBH4_9FLAO|nr:hypothetical protein [Capnocytophaga felis]GET46919.1 hypothetical protein RCZ01_22210 [Capnocytophaga felis]GET49439.1 hypothetical protein RCZ02_22700 [Capnocytophaga felis]
METLKKKVNEVENCVRKDLPHLLEIEKGCVLHCFGNDYEIIYVDDEYVKLMKISNADVFLFRLCFVRNHFEVIGLPVTMTHIFQWVCEKHKDSDISFIMECNRWIMSRKSGEEADSVDIPVNIDENIINQPRYFVDFIHSLIQK